MNEQLAQNKLVWSSPEVQTKMGAKDALVQIRNMKCGLPDTFGTTTRRPQRRSRRRAPSSARDQAEPRFGGEGIWLVWLADKDTKEMVPLDQYPAKTFGEKESVDDDMLKLMEMNDNHVEYHTVRSSSTSASTAPAVS